MMATVIRTDVDIQQDVLDEFAWDPEVEPTEVGVQIDDGIVTLTGTVDTYMTKLAAERAAQRIDGVRAVANDLVVKWSGVRTDTDIARAVADAIEANISVPREHVDITVKDGKVTLTGQVDWEFQRMAAGDTIRHLAGVREVINLITIRQPRVSPKEVKTGIEEALVRSAEVDAGRIQVNIEDGRVRLTGMVRSWPEKHEAGLATWRAKGVTQVTNDIVVRPS
jgi:osmotically-inducible protein OsmY